MSDLPALVAIDGGFEVWHGRRLYYRFERRPRADPVHADWMMRHGGECAHPGAWVFRGRILVPGPEVAIVFGNPGHALHWDECLLCGARFNPRWRPPLEGARPLGEDIETYVRPTLRDEARRRAPGRGRPMRPGERAVYDALRAAQQPLTAAALAQRTQRTHSGVARALARLEEQGRVDRVRGGAALAWRAAS